MASTVIPPPSILTAGQELAERAGGSRLPDPSDVIKNQAWKDWAENEVKRTRSLESEVKALRDVGKSYDDIESKLKQLGFANRDVSKAMQGYHRSLSELKDLPLTQVFSEWKSSLGTLGRSVLPVASLGLLAKTFLMLDEAGARLNRTMGSIAIQTGNAVRGYGFGGIAGGNRTEEIDRLRTDVSDSTKFMLRLGYSAQQVGEVMGTIAKTLPSSVAQATPQFAQAATALAMRFDMQIGPATELLVTSFRRGITSGEGLRRIFDDVQRSAKENNLSVDETTEGMNILWRATYRYGGTLDDTHEVMSRYKYALQQQLLTTEELAQMQGQLSEASPAQVAALAEMARRYAPENKATELFGRSDDIMDIMGNFIENQASIAKEGPDLIKTIVQNMATKEGGAPKTHEEEMGRIFLFMKSMPQIFGNAISTAQARGLGYFGPIERGIEGRKPPEFPLDIGIRIKESFKGVSDESLELAHAFQSLTKQAGNLKELLKVEGAEQAQRLVTGGVQTTKAMASNVTSLAESITGYNRADVGSALEQLISKVKKWNRSQYEREQKWESSIKSAVAEWKD